MILQRSKRRFLAVIACLAMISVACGEEEDSETEDTDDAGQQQQQVAGGSGQPDQNGNITISGILGLDAGLSLTQTTLDNLVFYCVTFSSPPVAASTTFGTDGSFSLQVPADTQFGCFINDATTNLPLASLVIESGSADDGFGGDGDQSALSFAGSVDLGSLTLGEDGRVGVPLERVSASQSSAAAVSSTLISLEDLHDSEWTMSCSDAVGPEMQAACQRDIVDSDDGLDTVYFRVVEATNNGVTAHGLSIWASRAVFEACGSFDMSTEEAAGLTGDGWTLSAGTSGDWTLDSESCPTWDDFESGDDQSSGDSMSLTQDDSGDQMDEGDNEPAMRYAFNRIRVTGAGYSFVDHHADEHENPEGQRCRYEDSLTIDFTGSATQLLGAFSQNMFVEGEACRTEDRERSGRADFIVIFTPN